MDWRPYAISLGAGLLVGVIYGLLNVRSPAPPIIALVGLLGILAGEQIPHLAKRALAGHEISLASVRQICWNHMFGRLPTRSDAPAQTADAGRTDKPVV